MARTWLREAVRSWRERAEASRALPVRIAAFCGNPWMLAILTFITLAWIGINCFGPTGWRFDRSPGRDLLLFNLLLSAISSYTSPVILFNEAKSREADEVRDKALSEIVQRTESVSAYLADQISYIDSTLDEGVTRAAWREEMRVVRERLAHRRGGGAG